MEGLRVGTWPGGHTAQLAERSPDRGPEAWRGRQSEVISSCCIVGTHYLARVSNQGQRLDGHAPDQPALGRHCFPGHSLLCFVRTQHAPIWSSAAKRSAAPARSSRTAEGCSRARRAVVSKQRLVGTPARVHERQWSASWICAGTLLLASPHWHTFVLGKCPTGMFQGDAALQCMYVPHLPSILQRGLCVCLSDQPQARSAPVGLSATLDRYDAGGATLDPRRLGLDGRASSGLR